MKKSKSVVSVFKRIRLNQFMLLAHVIVLFLVGFTVQAHAQSMTNYSDAKHGFGLSLPTDWTVKEGMTEATVFKAVKKFADGQYLMLTVNAQLLDRSDYSMTDFKIEEMVGAIAGGYGEDSITLLSSGRGQVSGYPSVWLLVDKQHALVKPRVEYTVLVIQGRNQYVVSASCSKPLYPQYQNQIQQLGDSFTFTASASSAGGLKDDTGNNRLFVTEPGEEVVTEPGERLVFKPGEKPVPSFFKAFGGTFLKYLIIGIIIAVGSALWAKMKGKKNTETPNNSVDSDNE